jgi:hypothetical protein
VPVFDTLAEIDELVASVLLANFIDESGDVARVVFSLRTLKKQLLQSKFQFTDNTKINRLEL